MTIIEKKELREPILKLVSKLVSTYKLDMEDFSALIPADLSSEVLDMLKARGEFVIVPAINNCLLFSNEGKPFEKKVKIGKDDIGLTIPKRVGGTILITKTAIKIVFDEKISFFKKAIFTFRVILDNIEINTGKNMMIFNMSNSKYNTQINF